MLIFKGPFWVWRHILCGYSTCMSTAAVFTPVVVLSWIRTVDLSVHAISLSQLLLRRLKWAKNWPRTTNASFWRVSIHIVEKFWFWFQSISRQILNKHNSSHSLGIKKRRESMKALQTYLLRFPVMATQVFKIYGFGTSYTTHVVFVFHSLLWVFTPWNFVLDFFIFNVDNINMAHFFHGTTSHVIHQSYIKIL